MNKKAYSPLYFDAELADLLHLNIGIVSQVTALPCSEGEPQSILVSGLREGVALYTLKSCNSNTIEFGNGKFIKELGTWAEAILPVTDKGGTCYFLTECSRKLWKNVGTINDPRLEMVNSNLGISDLLKLKGEGFGKWTAYASIFRRKTDAPFELIVSVCDTSEYYPGERGVYGGRAIGINQEGLDIARDSNGNWSGGEIKGKLHLFIIEQKQNSIELKYKGKIKDENGNEIPIRSLGAVGIADFDGDKKLEAIVLMKWEHEVFKLSDKTGDLVFTRIGPLPGIDGPVVFDFQCPSPAPIKLPSRDLPDILFGSLSGEIYFIRNLSENGSLKFSAPSPALCEDHNLRVGSFSVPAFGDLNANGVNDLVVGVEDGYLYYIENKGTVKTPRWCKPEKIVADGKIIRVIAGDKGCIQGPDEKLHGYTCPFLYDWCGTGLLDIIMGDITGYYTLYRNIGTVKCAKFTYAGRFKINGKEFRTAWRVRPTVADIDGDGSPEMIFIDRQGMIAYYPKASHKDLLELKNGIRLVDVQGRWIRLDNTSGGEGRVKLYACNWSDPNLTDIIVGTSSSTPLPIHVGGYPKGMSTFVLLKNVGNRNNPMFVVKPLLLKNGQMVDMGHHCCAPAAADINGDGKLEIIAGKETGELLYFDNDAFK
ncbi:MAG: hypothetical protein A2Y10_17400 [Planctomycetes bacterium GWF2_41_51]|nr:MAG: hypothetical protein A2Y10_17400 [Planctomycetes bacterium GWF2_41_51]HBG28003.1 hypothetical protein [Phycisphaerales bacterium]